MIDEPGHLEAVDGYVAEVVASLGPVAAAVRPIAAAGARHRARLLYGLVAAGGGGPADGAAADRAAAAGAAVELLHLGTLLHDDIVDGATERRHQPALHLAVGLGGAIWAADALYAAAVELAGTVGPGAGRALAVALRRVADSQLLESTRPAVGEYWVVVDGKTVSLFDAVVDLAGELVGVPPASLRQAVSRFGRLFQYVDDLRDITGDPAARGKPVGTDARNELQTLPEADLAVSAASARGRVDELACGVRSAVAGTPWAAVMGAAVDEVVGPAVAELVGR